MKTFAGYDLDDVLECERSQENARRNPAHLVFILMTNNGSKKANASYFAGEAIIGTHVQYIPTKTMDEEEIEQMRRQGFEPNYWYMLQNIRRMRKPQ